MFIPDLVKKHWAAGEYKKMDEKWGVKKRGRAS